MPSNLAQRLAEAEREIAELRRFAGAVTQGNAEDRARLGNRVAHEVAVLTVLAQVCINLGVPTEQARDWMKAVGAAEDTEGITAPTEALIATLKLSGSAPAGRA